MIKTFNLYLDHIKFYRRFLAALIFLYIVPSIACLPTSANVCTDTSGSGACKDGAIDPGYYDDKDSVQDDIDYFFMIYNEDMSRCPQCGCKGMITMMH